jgi:PAS domain S-box-containing protein
MPKRLRRLYLAEEEARLQAEQGANAARALAHITEAVILIDDSDTIRFWNRAAEDLFRLVPGEVVGRPAEVVGHLPAIEQAVRDRQPLWPIQVDGEERWVSCVVTPFDGGRVLAVRDVTDEQLLERSRTEFVATAAHELRTPLAAVYGAAKTLLGQRELSAETRQKLLELVGDESARLTTIIEQLLTAAQLDRGQLPLVEAECDLRPLATSVLDAAATHAPSNIGFELVAPPVLQPVRCDGDRLRQVLVSLVDNAVKYSPAGGTVQIRLAEGAQLQIDVTDEGLGIPAAERERIFDKFYRLDPDMARGIGGSGLGLYISRRIVEQMGGRISVHSAVGGGSTFRVEFLDPAALGRPASRLSQV